MNIRILYWLLVAHRRCIQGAAWVDHHLVFLLLIWSLDYVCYLSCFKMGIISLTYANMIIGCLRGWNKKKNMHGVSSKAQWIDVLLLDIHAGMIQKLWLCMHQDYNYLLVTLVLYTKLWPCKESISIWILKLKTHTAASFMGLIIFCYHVYSFLWTLFNRTR